MGKDMNHKNPWLDIASYSIEDANRFKGREKAIVKFSGIVNNGIMSVLYANSGIGKTSFLNAGIDPQMIQRGYTPIHIVFPDEIFLSSNDIEKWLMANIQSQVQRDGKKWEDILKLTEEEQYKTKDILDKCSSSLWWMLHTCNLVDEEGKQYFPLLVFDQFEEVFVKSRKFGNTILENKLFQLLEELSNASLPPSIGDILEKLADKDIFLKLNHTADYKVIFSLRKEYLSDFDYWTQDRFSISELQQNRMLLLPLTRKQALRVITEQPSPEDEGGMVETLNNIQDEIIQKLDPRNHNEVEPFLLSVLCSRLYDLALENKKKSITIEDLSTYNVDNIILRFYEEKVSQIIKDTRHLSRFEYLLVDKEGGRNRVKIKELSSIDFDSYQTELEREHLIRKDTFNDDEVYVELIHDRIADAIMKKRTEGNKERTRRFKVLSAAMLLIVSLILLVGIPHQKSVDDCRYGTGPVDTIFEAYTAVCDSVLELQNVYVKKWAFYANPFIKTIHIKSKVTLEDVCFVYCPNLTKVIFDGDSIIVGENVFSYCPLLRTIQITDSARFLHVGGLVDVPQMDHFILPDKHKQCEVDVLGRTLRIGSVIWSQHIKEDWWYSSECYIPEAWKSYLQPACSSRSYLKWCKIITCNQISQHNYDRDNSYYLIDTVSVLPNFDSEAQNFLKNNVVYVSLSNVKEITYSLFQDAKLQKIDIPNVICIHTWAFANSKLYDVNAPNVQEIKAYAFHRTRNLQKHIQFNSLESIGNMAFSMDSLIKLEMPLLRHAAKNAFSSMYVDTLILPHSLFYRLDTTNLEEGLHYTLITDNDYYGINAQDFLNSSWLGDLISINRLTKCQYFFDADTNIVDLENRVSKLIIGANVGSPDIKFTNYDNLENISVDFFNSTYFAYKNILFCKIGTAYKAILEAPNQRRIFVYNNNLNIQVGDKTQEIILFAPNQHKHISCSEEQKKNITIYFPYGTDDYIRNLTKTNDLNGYKGVVEMTYLRTSYYNFAFRFVMNSHYKNYLIPLLLLFMFIICANIYIKQYFKSYNYKTKLLFLIVYTILSLLGLFVIISSTLLVEKIPTIQFHIVIYWFFVASTFALWTTYPHYPKSAIARDALKLLIVGSICFVIILWWQYLSYHDSVNIDMPSWTIFLLVVFVLSVVTLRVLQRYNKVIVDNYLFRHQLRRGLLILLYYIYFVVLAAFTYVLTEGTNFEGESILLIMLFSIIMCGGFCIAHWRIRKRMKFKYDEYLKIRATLKYQQSIPFDSDYVLKRRIRVCYVFGIVSFTMLLILGEFYDLSYHIASYCLFFLVALQPILMHIYLVYNHISYSDLIEQYVKEYQMMHSISQLESTNI